MLEEEKRIVAEAKLEIIKSFIFSLHVTSEFHFVCSLQFLSSYSLLFV